MTRELRNPSQKPSNRRHNFAAAIVAGGAIAFLYYNFEPVTAEEPQTNTRQLASLSNIDARLSRQTASLESLSSVSVPQPPDSSADQVDTQGMSDRYAVLFAISQLQRGIEKLERHPNYSTVLERQERINGVLQDEQQIELKLRHAPFSVYMKWMNYDKGRELLFSENENEGRMLVRLGGLKGRLVPTLRLDPTGDRAMSETRHSVAQAGLINLAKEIINHRQKDLETGNVPVCKIEEGLMFDNRPCYKMEVEYRKPSSNSVYRRCITLIDEQLSLPVYVKNYTWPDKNTVNIEEDTLVECYSYTNIQFEEQLADAIWEHDNPGYRFKR